MTIKKLQKKIISIKKELMDLGDMHPGSLSKQWNVCGQPTCKCKDPENPIKHGPYYNLSFTYKGKGGTKFIRADIVEDVKKQISNYKKFKELIDEWKNTAMEISKMKFDEQKKNK